MPTVEFPAGQDTNDPANPDYLKQNIPSQRDLEDWTRLWIVGLPLLSTNCEVTLSWNVISGNPAINLAEAVETNGGTGYLTDPDIAAEQSGGEGISYKSYKFANVTSTEPFTFLPTYLNGNVTNCFLFEGAGIGEGELVLTVSEGGTNVLLSTSTFIDIHDVHDLYERPIITNSIATIYKLGRGSVTNMTFGLLKTEYPTVIQQNEDTNIIIYAHGADNTDESWFVASDTIFKRLYWEGYRGRFASVRWPSPSLNVINYNQDWFNVTEYIGLKSASFLRSYVTNLQARFPTYSINMWAHSAGGPIATEAFKEGAPFKSLILSSTTVPASCYDSNAPTNASLVDAEIMRPTPESQPLGYRGAYTNLAQANIVNFYNTNDELLIGAWLVINQLNLKPSTGYTYDGTNSNYLLTFRGETLAEYQVTDPLESRAMVSRSRSAAIGAQGPATGQTRQGAISSAVDLHAEFGLGSSDPEHGAFFMRPIQTVLPYYQEVMTDCNIPLPQLQ